MSATRMFPSTPSDETVSALFAVSAHRSQRRRSAAQRSRAVRGGLALVMLAMALSFAAEGRDPLSAQAQTGGAQAGEVTGGAQAQSSPAEQPSAEQAGGTPAGQPSGSSGGASVGQQTPQAGEPAVPSKGRTAGVRYGKLIIAAARAHRVEPALLAGLVRKESRFDRFAVSHAGAAGLTQLMPATAAAMGVTDRTDPEQALAGGAKYLREQLDTFRSQRLALAAYNAGPAAVIRHRGVPPYAETRGYVRHVLQYRDQFRAMKFGR